MNHFKMLADLTHAILRVGLSTTNVGVNETQQVPIFKWKVHPFGFLRLDVSPELRLHVWHPMFHKPGVSMIHDHAQWDFESFVLHGAIHNFRYREAEQPGDVPNLLPYESAVIVAGTLEGGLKDTKPTWLAISEVQRIEIGNSYVQQAHEIHHTEALPGTITLLKKEPKETNTARVFWPKGSEWSAAKPESVSCGDRVTQPGHPKLHMVMNTLAQAAGDLRETWDIPL